LIWSTKVKFLANDLKDKIERNMTEEEWNTYVAEDVEYQKTLEE
jgi:hypothetical protein